MKILYKVIADKDFYFAKTQKEIKKGEVLEVTGGDKELLEKDNKVSDYIESLKETSKKISIKKLK